MLKTMEPERVLRFFEEICSIPHGSGNEKALSDYLYSFAKSRGLWVAQDEALNIVIKKPASPGMEASEPVIIQSHMDMVCEKNMDTDHDFKKDPLKLYVDGDFLKAKGTTLGADNGIAVAMSLALLDLEDCCHPPLEIVVTTNEEVGLLGARDFDASLLSGKRLINLDSGREGEFCISCAGGMKVYLHLPVDKMPVKDCSEVLSSTKPAAPPELFPVRKESCGFYTLKVSGLNGGHSGMEIQKERGNSIRILGRALDALERDFDLYLWNVCGGLADNAIPREAQAFFALPSRLLQAVESKVKELDSTYRGEYRISDPGLRLILEKAPCETEEVFTPEFSRKVIAAMVLIPNGIQAMSLDIPGLVETSNNMGVLSTNKDTVEITTAIRSSVVSRKYAVRDQMLRLAGVLGGSVEGKGDYPGWQYNPVSTMRDIFGKVYEKRYGKPVNIMAIHAGLECGYFTEKIPDVDMISLGPDILGAHTPEERLSIPSLQRTWGFLLEALSLL